MSASDSVGRVDLKGTTRFCAHLCVSLNCPMRVVLLTMIIILPVIILVEN